MRIGNFEINRVTTDALISTDRVCLTVKGKAFVEDNSFGDGRDKVLEALSASGTMSIDELSNDYHIPVFKAKDILNYLISKGYVKKVGFDDNTIQPTYYNNNDNDI